MFRWTGANFSTPLRPTAIMVASGYFSFSDKTCRTTFAFKSPVNPASEVIAIRPILGLSLVTSGCLTSVRLIIRKNSTKDSPNRAKRSLRLTNSLNLVSDTSLRTWISWTSSVTSSRSLLILFTLPIRLHQAFFNFFLKDYAHVTNRTLKTSIQFQAAKLQDNAADNFRVKQGINFNRTFQLFL